MTLIALFAILYTLSLKSVNIEFSLSCLNRILGPNECADRNCVFSIFSAIQTAQCATLYVAPGGVDPTCASVSTPCGTVGAALALAIDATNDIHLAAGVYNSTGNINLILATVVSVNIIGAGQGVTVLDLQQAGASTKARRSVGRDALIL